jgi:SnoaL-like domain
MPSESGGRRGASPVEADVGLLFKPNRPLARSLAHPAPAGPAPRHVTPPVPSCGEDRCRIVRHAILATIADEPLDLGSIFCEDVVGSAPTVAVTSRRDLERACRAGEDALHHVTLDIHSLDVIGDHKAVAEWRMSGIFGGPFLLGEDRLVEPTGQVVRLAGVTIAEFHGSLIRSFRHYLDDASLLEQMLSLS